MVDHDSTVHDFLSVGFGPAGLAIAVAAYEKKLLSFVALEKQEDFKWHPGMLIPGAHMQISFIKDLATLRDPKSEFTFLNYLFEHGRLLKFLNLDTFLPAREEYQDYMYWAAKKVDSSGSVKYNTSVKTIEPTDDRRVLKVVATGPAGESTFFTKNVILCTGGQPSIPESFPKHNHLHHSSEFLEVLPKIGKESELKHGICVIGSGQSAAEIWTHLTKVYPNTKINLKFRSSALKPSDDSPFVNEIFDPAGRIDEWYEMKPDARQALITESRATNYSVVRLTLLEEMYHHLYTQELPGHEKPHTLSPNTSIESWDADSSDSITIETRNVLTDKKSMATFDYIFCATGYQRTFHKEVLSKFDDVKWNKAADEPATDRLYRVQRTDGDHKAGIYLQGLCESSHGLSDTLLSVLSTRGMEVVEDIQKRDSLQPAKPSPTFQSDAFPGSARLPSTTGSDYGSVSSPERTESPTTE
ncbi:protein of unknown function [Taphrina deformans PYCC 5710]|uniref:L-ornithine N(5)-monooxygenase [NAD(P)H] n=1 Tax=Taphrina deformans (strain PYCC 5710 / ATCC 11124 / CBS 356.35 / IMI 108563 / JCM 9778 / NBRC 8474) TaxID=1097556 RepID=R4XI75_TAPDE|nr:protein of unknown function [Taphrina deformans PYCC 5710]|eukprot:CCG84184.1 protein of unknown function [Taphrina deformans PYCC 5710]